MITPEARGVLDGFRNELSACFGTQVKIMVEGKEMTIEYTEMKTSSAREDVFAFTVSVTSASSLRSDILFAYSASDDLLALFVGRSSSFEAWSPEEFEKLVQAGQERLGGEV